MNIVVEIDHPHVRYTYTIVNRVQCGLPDSYNSIITQEADTGNSDHKYIAPDISPHPIPPRSAAVQMWSTAGARPQFTCLYWTDT